MHHATTLLRAALLLQLAGEGSNLRLKLEGKGGLQAIFEVVIERIGEVLVLGPQQLKLTELGKLESSLETCEFSYMSQLFL